MMVLLMMVLLVMTEFVMFDVSMVDPLVMFDVEMVVLRSVLVLMMLLKMELSVMLSPVSDTFSCCSCGRSCCVCSGVRYWRFNSPTGKFMRGSGFKTYIWPGFASWSRGFSLFA